jgi:hypothetical protein
VLNPLENAVLTLLEKNSELVSKIGQMAACADGGADQSMTMSIFGVVDSPVNGGVAANYGPFLTGSFARTNPEILEDVRAHAHKGHLVEALRAALRVQLRLLRRGVRLHASKCSEAMRPLHEHMQTSFQKLELECAPLIEHA